jgi:hypothetical protein
LTTHADEQCDEHIGQTQSLQQAEKSGAVVGIVMQLRDLPLQ